MKWYVYELIDPRSDKAFYVGKGCGRRAESHLTCKMDHPKNHKMSEIKAAGYLPLVRRVAYFWEESDALDHEAHLIARYGELTNIARNERPAKYVGLFDVLRDLGDGKIPAARARARLEGFLGLIRKMSASDDRLAGFKEEFIKLCESYIRLIDHPVIGKKLWPAH